jgi:hypothetical protein
MSQVRRPHTLSTSLLHREDTVERVPKRFPRCTPICLSPDPQVSLKQQSAGDHPWDIHHLIGL